MLNPTMKRWKLERCLFARDALNSIHERYRASGLSIVEFAKTQPPSLLQTALIQRIDNCYEDEVMSNASHDDLSKGATMARKMQLMQIFDQKTLPESLRPYLGKMAAADDLDYCEDKLASGHHMKQILEYVKQREDGLAWRRKMEQLMLVWYIRAIKSRFKELPEKLRTLLGDAGKQDNLLQKRLNDEINSICMATVLFELWVQMSKINQKRKEGAPRAVFDLVVAHQLADKDGKLTTSDGRHFTAESQFFQLRCDTDSCYGTFTHLASVWDLVKHMHTHKAPFKHQLWFVPLIDADSPLLRIKSLRKYYVPGHYSRHLDAPSTRPMHIDYHTGDYDGEHSHPVSNYSDEAAEHWSDGEDLSQADANGVGMNENESGSGEDEYVSAADPMLE
ncbi:hypothetical protein BCR37DRAFT_394051 [Protomyces lactucae-debilis]|uniref:Uncharacterized protein n=1 Tax=Protomyces lactucae-debilis TaxID=2754530 RepID=A0A1Y2F7V4_PROLT|nr:uncharacterized protein BCR37DRAFT_394051 [Protomyces lactucae-debilis]ORY79990.1 hypothetical protein BCR37DRAFT_394051 [Protomyces lactucae-debilis]